MRIEDLTEFARKFCLELHDAQLARDIAALARENRRPTDERLLAGVKQRVEPYVRYAEINPFPVAPPGTIDKGEFFLARQVSNSLRIMLSDVNLLCHMLIIGASGSGKTTLLRRILKQILRLGKALVIIDKKDDALRLACDDERFLLISPRARLNILQKPEFLSCQEWISVFCDIYGKSLFSGDKQKNVLSESLTKVFADQEHPSLADVIRCIRTRSQKTFGERDANHGVISRIERFGRQYPNLYATRNGVSWEALFDHSIHISSLLGDDLFILLSTLYLTLLYLRNRRLNIRNELTHLLVADEAQALWATTQNNIESLPPMAGLHGMYREYSIASIITTNNLETLHPIIKSNIYASVAFNTAGGQETRSVIDHFNLDEAQAEYAERQLRKGTCLIRLADGWKHPILARTEALPIEKKVSFEERAAAEERINRFAPAGRPPEVGPVHTKQVTPAAGDAAAAPPSAASQPIAATPTQTPPSDASHPTAARPTQNEATTVAPPQHEPTPSVPSPKPQPVTPTEQRPDPDAAERPPVKLTVHEERLLRTTTEKLWIATRAYEAAKLSRQAGQNAKDKLVKLDLLATASILVRAGRGGNALAIAPTPAGYELLGRKRPKGTKGGDSAQHRWLIQELAAAIHKAQIEVLLGGKSIDLLIPFDQHHHHLLLFHMEGKELSAGALLALEVETSAPTRTAVNNITKNSAVGVAHTIVAVLPKHVAATTASLEKRLPKKLRDSYSVVNVFELLAEVRV